MSLFQCTANRFANLKIGSVRYGVVCDDAGIILDDGTISRLGEDRFFLTTTTGNADSQIPAFESSASSALLVTAFGGAAGSFAQALRLP